jgi:hypothetical protein
MSKPRRRAGQNVRDLAINRRLKAIYLFISSGFIIFLPWLILTIFNNFLKDLPTFKASQHQAPKLQLPVIFYGLFVFIAVVFMLQGINFWQLAKRADQGAKGEEDIAQVLIPLKQQGWQIEYGKWLGNGLGDADIICVSPQGKAYVIDVKSHRGQIITDGQYLSRRMGQKIHQFEKDFLELAMKQALQVKKQKQLNFVTPIIAFSQAKVSVPSGKLRGVYVVDKLNLVSLLKSLG